MRNSSVLIGLLAGLALAGLLSVPLAIDYPAALVPRWPSAAPGMGLWSWIGAVLVPIAAGYLSGWINRDEAIRAGAGSGTVASLFAVSAIQVPAVGVWAASSLYSAAGAGRLTTQEMEGLLADALLTSAWAPSTFGAVLLCAGLGLGTIGGFLAEMTAGLRQTREVQRSSVPMVGLLATTCAIVAQSALAAHAELTLLPALHHPVEVTHRVALATPLAAAGLASALLLAWTTRDGILLWRSGRRAGGLLWTGLAASLVLAGHVASVTLHPLAWVGPWPWAALGMELLAVIVALFVHRKSELTLAEAPPSWFELAIEGLEMGIVSVSLFALAGGGTASVWAVQLLPVAWAVASGSAQIPIEPRAMVLRQFLVHLGAPVVMALVAGAYAALATPMWLFGRAVLRRAEARAT